MSNHYSAANLKFPGDDARLDFTDLWVFPRRRSRQDGDHHGREPVRDRHERDAAVPDAVGLPPRRGLPAQRRPGWRRAGRGRVHVHVLRADGRQADRDAVLCDRGRGPSGRARRRRADREHPGRVRRCQRHGRHGRPGPAVHRRAQRPVLRRRRRLLPRLSVDRPGRVRGQEHPLDRDGSAARHAQPRPGSGCGRRSASASATARWSRSTGAGIRPSTRSSTRTTSRTPTTSGSRSTTSPPTWGPGPRSCRTTAATRPRRRSRRPASCCPTSFATTAASRSGTRTGAP